MHCLTDVVNIPRLNCLEDGGRWISAEVGRSTGVKGRPGTTGSGGPMSTVEGVRRTSGVSSSISAEIKSTCLLHHAAVVTLPNFVPIFSLS